MGEDWPKIGRRYLVWINGTLQQDTYEFDQGDDGFGSGEYFWSRDDVDESPRFDPESDRWLDISELESRLAAAEADADRLDWWQNNPEVEILADERHPEKDGPWVALLSETDESGENQVLSAPTLRGAIDAARGGE